MQIVVPPDHTPYLQLRLSQGLIHHEQKMYIDAQSLTLWTLPVSCFRICFLLSVPGSERNHTAQINDSRVTESGYINKSLFVLGQCIDAMRSAHRVNKVEMSDCSQKLTFLDCSTTISTEQTDRAAL
jgi:hypothetical protein